MRDFIFIAMDNPLAKKVDWVIRTKLKTKESKTGTLKEAAKACSNRRIILIIPGSEILLTESDVPTKNRHKLLKAIPFSLEEYIIDDVETQHFAIQSQKNSNKHAVAVISKERLDAWRKTLFDSCGMRPDTIVPDTLLVPEKSGWNMIIARNQCFIRTGTFNGVNCTLNEMLNYFKLLISFHQDKLPSILHCWTNPKHINNEIIEFFVQHKIKLVFEKPGSSLVSLLASSYRDSTSINLLQGEYGDRNSNRDYLQKWVPAATACMLWLIIIFAGNVVDYFESNNKIKRLQAEMLIIDKSTFPDAKPSTRLRKKIAKTLITLKNKRGVSQHHFIELLGATGDATKNIKTLTLTKLKFENNRLSIYFIIDDTSKIDQIEKSLELRGFKVNRGPSNRKENGFSSHLVISGSKS